MLTLKEIPGSYPIHSLIDKSFIIIIPSIPLNLYWLLFKFTNKIYNFYDK